MFALILFLLPQVFAGPANEKTNVDVRCKSFVGSLVISPESIQLLDTPENRIPPPPNVPYVVFGVGENKGDKSSVWQNDILLEDYKVFAIAMGLRLKHKVISYEGLLENGLITRYDDKVNVNVRYALATLYGTGSKPGLAGDAKMTIVNLDGFDPHDELGFRDNSSGRSITARELFHILSNPKYFKGTRWFKNGKELTESELKPLFKPYFPELFGK